MDNAKKIAYIKGLMEGMDFKPDTPERKVLIAIVDALESITDTIHAIEEDTAYISEYVEEVDQDLGDVEEIVFGEEDYDDDYDDDDDWDDDDEDEEFYELECPACGKKFCISEDMLDLDSIQCPKCGEDIELDLEICECDCEDCGECDCCDGDNE